MLALSKMGSDHKAIGMNNQDYAVLIPEYKRAFLGDGCSSSPHPEVGLKLYAFLLQNRYIEWPFDKTVEERISYLAFNFYTSLLDCFPPRFENQALQEFCLFTILFLSEFESDFSVDHIGDGFVILQTKDNKIEYVKLEDSVWDEEKKEFVTNYLATQFYNNNSKFEKHFGFKTITFKKEEYKKTGLSSDGLRYLLDDKYKKEKEEFESILLNEDWDDIKKRLKITLFVNMYPHIFKDDFSIVW